MLFSINEYSHRPFLSRELKQLLPDGTFASRLWRAIGAELHYRLVEWEPQNEVEYSSLFPVESLFLWVTKDGGLDPEWLASENGSYLDDDGEVIPSTLTPSYSAVEQLAAYGLWLISENEMDCCGLVSEQGANENGFNRDEVIEHRAACMLLAYQALSYAQRIMLGTKLSPEENEKAEQFNFSKMGKAGAAKRHAPMAALRSWAIEKYRAGKWPSANQAANDLQGCVIDHGRTIGANLSKANAQRTIAEWFRKSV